MADKTKKIKALIVDDHSVVRDGVEAILNKTEDIELCWKAASVDEALKIFNSEKIDLAIIDITLSGSISGIDFVKAVTERFPAVAVLVMSMHDESIYGERAIRAGAKGYVMKEVASLNLVDAIRIIMSGELYISEKLQKKVVSKLIKSSGDPEGISVEVLSDREFEIFQLIGNGFSTRELAEKLNISTNTVESHRNRIKSKLNLKSSAELVKHAIQWVISNSK